LTDAVVVLTDEVIGLTDAVVSSTDGEVALVDAVRLIFGEISASPALFPKSATTPAFSLIF
jgi:hypothetical protein